MPNPMITVDQASNYLDDPDSRFIDCRFALADTDYGRVQFSQGHIPGAVYAHLDYDLSGAIIPGVTGRHPLPDPNRFCDTLSGWGITKETHVIVYDDGPSQYAARAWWLLNWINHPSVRVLDGGWNQWKAKRLPEESSVRSYPTTAYKDADPVPIDIDADTILSMIGSDKLVLLDARAPDRFSGATEPLDPVAGHIPGAINFPWTKNVSGSGTLLSPEDILTRFRKLNLDDEESEIACYCGSGVTAAHNVLALQCAGIRGVKLYAGSWSEWITDPNRPVSVGN